MIDSHKLTFEEIEELKRIKATKSRIAKHSDTQSKKVSAVKERITISASNLKKKSGKVGIVINRMYVGGYLQNNLGHEIINLFQADNGMHYLYLNASGSFAKEHDDINYMLMVKYAGKDRFEVIGLAKDLEIVPGSDGPRFKNIKQLSDTIYQEQKNYILSQPEGGIKYGGVSLLDIFKDAEQQSVFVTYKAKEVFVPQGNKRIFLKYQENAYNSFGEKEITVAIRQHNLPKTSLKSYIYPSQGEPTDSDYENIVVNLIKNEKLWSSERDWRINPVSVAEEREVSLFDICQIQDDENRFSNALAYFMNHSEYRNLWIEFFSKYGVFLNRNYNVEREVSAKIEDAEKSKQLANGGRIDLLISDDENLVVIENKIKSDINTIEKDFEGDTTQLNRYENYINWRISKENSQKKGHFLILCPDYNKPDLRESEKNYRIITYGELFNFLEKQESVESDINFRALKNAMMRHTHLTANGYLYSQMLEKFAQRINEKKRILK